MHSMAFNLSTRIAMLPSTRLLIRNYAGLAAGFILFIGLLAWLEKRGIEAAWLGYAFLFVTIALYALIGLFCRTSNLNEYYVAGRRIPAVFNGMATAADWISAASFIGLVGTLYVAGFDGLAYVMGWTGGYVLVALLVAPTLRAFGGFTLPEFLGARFASSRVRFTAVLALFLCSFIYLVAQIQGVGLITQRFIGVEFTVGVFLGLAGILVCSFLGGMRAITWTQVAQYLILILAFLLPVGWIAWQQTGSALPTTALKRSLQTIEKKEIERLMDPAEHEVQQQMLALAAQYEQKIEDLPQSYHFDKLALKDRIQRMKQEHAPLREIKQAEKVLANFPQNEEDALARWQEQRDLYRKRAEPIARFAEPYAADQPAQQAQKRINFIALLFCLMLGTASMPHVLTRFLTTPDVASTRRSVGWTLFFILLLYLAAPMLAAIVKANVLTELIGTSAKQLPNWFLALRKVDGNFAQYTDWNHDGIVQYAEVVLHPDIVMLALPGMFGLPSVVAGLIAAGALAAALSTADGLLLTLANAFSHDLYYANLNPHASPQRRVTIAKIILLVIALLAAYVTSLRPGNILSVVGAAFSLAASSLFPAILLAVYWPRAHKQAVLIGMVGGTLMTVAYMLMHYPFSAHLLAQLTGLHPNKWFGIEPIAAAVFGVPCGFLLIFLLHPLCQWLTNHPTKRQTKGQNAAKIG